MFTALNTTAREIRHNMEARKEFMAIAVVILAIVAFKIFFEFGTNIGEFIYCLAH